MSGDVTLEGRAAWLHDPDLQRLLSVLSQGGEEARIAGGAVRNALLAMPVTDIDIATTTPPEETSVRVTAAGFKAVPTGFEHGTVTVVAGGKPYEVTTLRADVETDGRRARVRFGRDWREDARRRDFTINGLYAEAGGKVIDLVGGLADIPTRTVRFIGEPDLRIREDYLRILRFFRVFAWYGSGRPDADGLRACARLKDGLDGLSAERVQTELIKLFAAPDPSRAILWMRQTGVLTKVLPESEKWGIDSMQALIGAERDLGWQPDPLLRLEAIVPPDPARMAALADRLRLSRAQAERLTRWAAAPAVKDSLDEGGLRRLIYGADRQAIVDRLRLSLVAARSRAIADNDALVEAGRYQRLLSAAEGWERPSFPVKGGDIEALGVAPGPALGAVLRRLEQEWVEAGFSGSRDALLKRAAAIVEEKA